MSVVDNYKATLKKIEQGDTLTQRDWDIIGTYRVVMGSL